jgi:hypothetical protein
MCPIGDHGCGVRGEAPPVSEPVSTAAPPRAVGE